MTLTLFAEAASSASSAFGASDQAYLFQARQMQALSFAAHIPLVCFGIAFPAFVVFVEWLHLRTGDDVYRVLARRWSKVMLALFAVGVVTGTILSFEMGLLWPNFMATFGDVFGLGFTIEGISFFVEAIFIGIYVYGWDRLSPRTHLLTGIPIILSGFTGSLMVIAVNGWMNHPTGFTLEDGRAVDVHPWAALFENSYFWHELIHMYIAGFMVAGFLTASAYAWPILRGRTSRYNRTALIVPLTIAALAAPVQIVVGDWAARDVAKTQPVKLAALEGLATTREGRARAPARLVRRRRGRVRDQDPQAALAARVPRSQRDGAGARHGAGRRSAAGQRRPLLVPDDGRRSARGSPCSASSSWRRGSGCAGCRPLAWFYRAVVVAGPASVVALLAGWITTEVGRQPWVVYRVMRTSEAVTGASGIPVGYATLALVYAGLAVAVAWLLRRLARAPLELPEPSVAPAGEGGAHEPR